MAAPDPGRVPGSAASVVQRIHIMHGFARFLAPVLLAVPAVAGAQEIVLKPDAIYASVDTMYTVSGLAHADTIATSVQTLRRVTRDGAEAWEMAYVWTGEGGPTVDTTFFSAATLRTISQHRVKPTHRTTVRFDGSTVVSSRLELGADQWVQREFRFDQPIHAGSMMDVVYRALPLTEGFRTRLAFFIPEQADAFLFDVRVIGVEDVEVRGRTVQAWRLLAGGESDYDTFWISRDTRQLLKVELSDGNWIIL